MLRITIFDNIKKHIFSYLLLLIVVFLIVFLSIVPAKVLEMLINNYFLNDQRNNKILYNLVIIYCGAIIASGILEFFKNLLLIYLGESFTKDLRYQMAKKLDRLAYSCFLNNDTGEIVSYFTNDVEAINSLFTEGIISMFVDFFKVIAITIQMFIYNLYLGLFTILCIPLILVLTVCFKKRIFNSQLLNQKILSKVNNHLSETMNNIFMIKAYSKEDYFENSYSKYLDMNYKTEKKVTFYDSFYSPLIQIITALLIVLIVIISNKELRLIAVNVGIVAGSIQYITSLFSPVEKLGMELQTVQKSMSGLKRIKDFLNISEKQKIELVSESDFIEKGDFSISFEHVTFGYDKSNVVIKDLNLRINKGDVITFAGRTGAGKTTIFNLLFGYLKPNKGGIYLNGKNVLDVSDNLKYQLFGYVPQSFKAINGSLKDNITIKRTDMTDCMVLKSLEIVGLSNKVRDINLPFNEYSFSQGELQLLNIARAICPNPKILLFDEITSSLDNLTEKMVLDAIQKVSKNRTIISISHRLNECFEHNKIIYVENGVINIGK